MSTGGFGVLNKQGRIPLKLGACVVDASITGGVERAGKEELAIFAWRKQVDVEPASSLLMEPGTIPYV